MEYNRKPKYAGIETLEEGEILSDDLEAISDDPIDIDDLTPYHNGKSLKDRDHLTDLSLSSISEIEEIEVKKSRKRRKFKIRRKKVKHFKPMKKLHSDIDSSDEDNHLDLDLDLDDSLRCKLKAAVQIESTETQKNTLRERLQPLIDQEIIISDTNSTTAPLKNDNGVENEHESEENVSDVAEEHDDELIQLRLDALETALKNKFVNGKYKKNVNKITSYDTDKKNTNNNCPLVNTKTNDVDKPIAPVSHQQSDEDEAILRAQVFATMASQKTKECSANGDNKIDIEKEPVQKVEPAEKNIIPKVQKLENTIKGNVNNFKVNSKQNTNQYQFKSMGATNITSVKPLIISLNSSDSDSDIDIGNDKKNEQNSKEIENSVEKFLRDQRAKVESERRITNTNLTPLKNKILKKSILPNGKRQDGLDQSLLKLLPENKQREYSELLLKLKKAQQSKLRTKIKSSSEFTAANRKQCVAFEKQSINNNGSTSTLNKVNELNGSTNTKASIVVCSSDKIPATEKQTNATSSYSQYFYRIMKQIHVQNNGRFQIQEKYEPLRQLAKKIKIFLKEQGQYDQEEKNLMEELEMLRKRKKLGRKNIAISIKNLTDRKQEIDKKNLDEKPSSDTKIIETDNQCKLGTIPKQPECSIVNNLANQSVSTVQTTSTKSISNSNNLNGDSSHNCVDKANLNSNLFNVSCSTHDKDSTVRNGQLNNKVKYVSPLDHTDQKAISDPFQIICPFAIQGSCKDMIHIPAKNTQWMKTETR